MVECGPVSELRGRFSFFYVSAMPGNKNFQFVLCS